MQARLPHVFFSEYRIIDTRIGHKPCQCAIRYFGQCNAANPYQFQQHRFAEASNDERANMLPYRI